MIMTMFCLQYLNCICKDVYMSSPILPLSLEMEYIGCVQGTVHRNLSPAVIYIACAALYHFSATMLLRSVHMCTPCTASGCFGKTETLEFVSAYLAGRERGPATAT